MPAISVAEVRRWVRSYGGIPGVEVTSEYGKAIVTLTRVEAGFDKVMFAGWLRSRLPANVGLSVRWGTRPTHRAAPSLRLSDSELRERLKEIRARRGEHGKTR